LWIPSPCFPSQTRQSRCPPDFANRRCHRSVRPFPDSQSLTWRLPSVASSRRGLFRPRNHQLRLRHESQTSHTTLTMVPAATHWRETL
jgi:hypothetical protein